MKLALFCLVLAVTSTHAAPPIDPAAARLFERAARVYGEAPSLALDYEVTSDHPALPARERGAIVWRKPDLYAQTFAYDAGQGHFAADAKSVYFTQVDGKTGRYAWKDRFGFWNHLPWEVPGHLAALLRGHKLYGAGGSQLRVLAAQKIEGVWCDGATLRESNGDLTRFWFARRDGTLRRESWTVKLPDGHANVQTRYLNVRLDPKLERAAFVRPAEESALVVNPETANAP